MNSAEEYYDLHRADREQWRSEQPQACMWCGREGFPTGLQIHEIVRRSASQRGWAHRCNFLLLCEPCHAQKFATMPLPKQLAVKFLRDRDNYDLGAWLAILGRPAVTPQEVHREAMLLRLPRLRPKQYPMF